MKILVTGGTGDVGRAVVDACAADGQSLTVVGRSPGQNVGEADYRQCDILDFDGFLKILKGHDAIIHLAAIRHPIGKPGRDVFEANDLGTFHVFEAAAEADISRVVSASSINAYGYFFGDRGVPLEYFPLDEDHPVLATDAYSFSKQVMESIGQYFWERDRISGTMLRLPLVMPHQHVVDSTSIFRRYDESIVDRLLGLSDAERIAELSRITQGFDQLRHDFRADTLNGFAWGTEHVDDPRYPSREEIGFMVEQTNFFAYVDEIDSAQSILKSVTASYDGSHALNINSGQNSLRRPLAEVARLYLPSGLPVRESANGDTTLVSIDRARELIGFAPEHLMSSQVTQKHFKDGHE